MRILIDADACPVTSLTRQIAAEHGVSVLTVASVAHLPQEGEVIVVDNAPEAADLAIFARVRAGDLVITGDYGLAALVLSKGAKALSPYGTVFTHENIDGFLQRRYLSSKIRRAGGRERGPRPRTRSDDLAFSAALRVLLLKSGQASRKLPAPAEE
jgi:uncharacterized protein YaiI (UPF0178 family)